MKNKRSTQKLFIKIFSVFAAIVLWLFVSFNEGEHIDANINSIEIQFVGEQTLSSRGLMLINKKSIPKASVKIRGRRSDLISVMGGITARVDLSRIDGEGTYGVTPSFDIPSSAVYISKVNTHNIQIEVAKAVEKIIDVEVVQENADKNKEYLVETVAETKKMKIVGEKNDIESIEKAYLYVDVSALTENQEFKVIPVFENDKRKEITPKNEISAEFSDINVKNTVYKRVKVGVEIQTPKESRGDFSLNVKSQSVEEVEVGISEGVKIDRLTADFSDIEIIEKGEQKFLLKLNVPEGVYLPEHNRIVEVEVEVKSKYRDAEQDERTTVTNVIEE